mmetsp:Transcript_82547/g.164601  ORF Transcript_82547/g.164601 Transcript_82547/m.164601 type:complete len:253 (-) Transcript_82547:1867-2625(-)
MATLTSRRAIKIRRARLLGWCWVLSSSAARRLPVERASAEAAASRACWVYSSALGVFTLSPTPSARASCSCLRLRPRRTTLNPAPYAPCDRAPLCPRDAWVRVRVLAHILPTCSHKGCLTVQSSIEVRSSDSCSVRPLPPQAPPLTPHSPSSHTSQLVPFWRQMFLPPGYPHTMVESYASYQLWARLETAIGWPRDKPSGVTPGPSSLGHGCPLFTVLALACSPPCRLLIGVAVSAGPPARLWWVAKIKTML